jgi:hypothetical protein
VAPDGRRKCGSVGNAIIEVLSGAESELRVRDIQARVEDLFGSPVSRGSVKGYLHNRSRGPWVHKLGRHAATSMSYSWMTPPSRSRRLTPRSRIRELDPPIGRALESGGSRSRDRWGRLCL